MTSIMFRPVAKQESGDMGAILKEVCAMPALSGVKLAANCKGKEFYIADVAEGADAQAIMFALRKIHGVLHVKAGANRDELESYVAKHAAMEPMDQIREMILAEPHGMIGYMSGKRKNYEAGEVKALFNHAAVPQPKELALAPDDSKYSITKAQKAALLYKTARNAGDGRLRSAMLWARQII